MSLKSGTFFTSGRSKEEKILTLLRKERKYYIDILEIEKKENHCLVSNPVMMDKFRGLQVTKRKIITHIQSLEVSLEPLKQYWKEKKDRTCKNSGEIVEELDILDHLLKSILQIDQQNQQLMEEKIKQYHLNR